MKNILAFGVLSAASMLAILSTVAYADTAATSDAEATTASELQEVTVTAERRSESLERTPLTVSVVGSDALIHRDITTESDLQFAAPGLIVRAGQNNEALNYSIRGESLDPFSNTRPGVLPYFDEIQVSSQGGSSAFYDLQSIQVLKGPQGTLFGRNSTGGAVLYTTNRPTADFGGYASVRFGDYDLRQVEAALNLPLFSDKLLLRIAAVSEYHNGYQINQNVDQFGEPLGVVRRNGARATLVFRPTDKFENTTVFDYLTSGGSPMTSVLYSLDPNGPIPTIAASNGVLPQYKNLSAFLAAQQASGPYKPNVDAETSFDSVNMIVSNITSYDITDTAQLRNIFGYTNIDATVYSDSDGSPYQIDDNGFPGSTAPSGKTDRNKQYTEELQAVGKTWGDKLTYTAGAYYAHERVYDFTTSRLLGVLAGPSPIDAPAATQYNTALTGSDTYAGYAQSVLDLSDATGLHGLSATTGARYTSETTIINMEPQRGVPGEPGYLPGDNSYLSPPDQLATFEFNQSHTYKNISWTLGLQEQVNSDLLIYLDGRRGYRNGGFNGFVKPVPGLGNVGGNRYDTEELKDVELGEKYQGIIAGMPVRLNFAAYISWILDAQRAASILVGGAPAAITVNVPRSLVKGFEFDGVINPVKWLSLGLSANYTDAKNTSPFVSIAGSAPVEFGTYPDAPLWSGTAFTEMSAPVSDHLVGTIRADEFVQTNTWFSGVGNVIPGTNLPGYSLTNFELRLEDPNRGWSVSANVKNAFNRLYWVGGEALGALFQVNMADVGNPRTFSIGARYKF